MSTRMYNSGYLLDIPIGRSDFDIVIVWSTKVRILLPVGPGKEIQFMQVSL